MLEFPNKLSESGLRGSPASGRLLGEITIEQALTAPEQPPLRCVTRNVHITPEKIWTAADVSFQWGRTHGAGRDLTVALQHDSYDRSAGAASYAGIQAVALRQVHHLTLDLADQRLLAKGADGEPTSNPTLGKEAGLLDVACQGQFRLDLRRNVAFFEKQVLVRRLLSDGPAESLACEHLELHFHHQRDSKPLRLPAAEPQQQPPDSAAHLQLVRIQAAGFPVHLKAPQRELDVQGEILRFDLETRKLLLDGERVQLRQGIHTVSASAVEYELRVDDPQRLGRLWAHGPGRIDVVGDGERPPLIAQWTNVLQLQPRDGEHVLSLQEGATLEIVGFGRFSAEQLHFYLRETPAEAPQVRRLADPVVQPLAGGASPATALSGIPRPAGSSPKAEMLLTPDRMLASGRVDIDSKFLRGAATECRIWFTHGPPAVMGNAINPGDPMRRTVSSNPQQWLQQWEGPPLQLQAGMIQAQVDLSAQQPSIMRASLHDRVSIRRQAADPRQSWSVAGDLMQYWAADGVVTLMGQPARIQSQQAQLEGPRITVSPSRGSMEVNGGGLVRALMEDGLRPSEVVWKGTLTFDGKLATVRDEVQFRGEQRQGENKILRFFGRTGLLEVELAREIMWNELHRDKLDRQPLELSKFDLSSPNQPEAGVYLEAATFAGSSQLSYDRVQMQGVTFLNASGEIHGRGPGVTTTTRAGGFDLPSLDPALGRFAAQRPEIASIPKLTFLQVRHQGPLHANIRNGYLRVEEGVQATLAPVARWEDRVVVQRREEMSDQTAVLYCQQLTVSQAATNSLGQRQLHLQAEGNAQIVGRQFSARTHRLSYDQSKDLVVLEGSARDSAELQLHRDDNPNPQSMPHRPLPLLAEVAGLSHGRWAGFQHRPVGFGRQSVTRGSRHDGACPRRAMLFASTCTKRVTPRRGMSPSGDALRAANSAIWRGAAPRWDEPDEPSGGGNLPASRDSLQASFQGFA